MPTHHDTNPPPAEADTEPALPEVAGNAAAVTGFVLALTGAVSFWIPFFGGLVLLFALIYSGTGLSRSETRPGNPHRGLAIAGLSVAIPMFIASALINTFFVVVLIATISTPLT